MSKKILIGVIVVLAIVLGIYFFLKPAGPATDGEGTAVTEGQEEVGEDSGRRMAFADFLRTGGSYKCEVTHEIDGASSSGVVYVHDDMVRSDYTTTVDGSAMDSHSIFRDGYSYTWTSLADMGFMVAVDSTELETDTSAGAEGDFSGFDPDQVGEYECDPWALDSTVFAVPANIEFMDMSEMMPSGQLPLD